VRGLISERVPKFLALAETAAVSLDDDAFLLHSPGMSLIVVLSRSSIHRCICTAAVPQLLCEKNRRCIFLRCNVFFLFVWPFENIRLSFSVSSFATSFSSGFITFQFSISWTVHLFTLLTACMRISHFALPPLLSVHRKHLQPKAFLHQSRSMKVFATFAESRNFG